MIHVCEYCPNWAINIVRNPRTGASAEVCAFHLSEASKK